VGIESSRAGWAYAPHPTVQQHLGWGGGKVSVALTHSHLGAALVNFSIFPIFSVFSPPCFSTHSGLCDGHAPLLIQKGHARTGQKVQPRRVGPCAAPNSSLAQGKGGGRDRLEWTKCHRAHAVALCCRTCFFSLLVVFSSSLPNLLEVVQRAHPSFNPKGTCPRWAESPAAPGGPVRRTHQFLSTREGGRNMSSKVSVALAECNVALVKCPSHYVAALACMLLRGFSLCLCFLSYVIFLFHNSKPP
jgi:hypothetical protein